MGREEREKRQAEQREKQRNRRIKLGIQPSPDKTLAYAETTANYDQYKVKWCFELFDGEIDWRDPNKSHLPHVAFCEVSSCLKNYSSMTWAMICSNNKRDHAVECDHLCKRARDRLLDLSLDDVDALFRFRLNGTHRLWGIRDRNVFRVIWWDPDHVVCPSTLKNT